MRLFPVRLRRPEPGRTGGQLPNSGTIELRRFEHESNGSIRPRFGREFRFAAAPQMSIQLSRSGEFRLRDVVGLPEQGRVREETRLLSRVTQIAG